MSSNSTDNTSASVSQLLSSLIPALILGAVYTLIFLVFRKKQPRVYEPRNTVKYVPEDLRPHASKPGVFAWITGLLKLPQLYILQQTGPDGYLFLRFLFEFAFICLIGCFLIWPVLFPITITNSNGLKQLDMFTIGNVKNKWRYLAQVFESWLFFGFAIFVIYRELVFYTTFRHALQTTPLYDSLLSSRTLLLTELPEKALDEDELRISFPTATNIWYAREYKELEKLVKERSKLANKYESSLSGALTKAVKMRNKCLKKKQPVPAPADDLNKYMKDGKKRPTHRLKFLIGKKVDTLEYGVERLGELNRDIKKKQLEHNSNAQLPSVFMEFPTQLELQKAYQAIPFSSDFKKCRRYTGLAPDDIVWENLSLTPTKRRVKKFIASTVLTLMIIFWAIPVAVVGAISNINFITEKLTFLKFINNMPSQLLGIITSLLPVVALIVLMSLVPPFIKKMGKVSGALTVQDVNSYCQNWFYAFQAVNSFVVITVASASVSSIQTIIDDPSSALTLLATKIPRASNFYIAYICVFGLASASSAIANVVGLILAQFLGRILDKTPRAKWNRYVTLGQPDFATLYPGFQFLALIAFAYSIIAPLILGFASISLFLVLGAFLYNMIHVMQPNKNDARGRNYPLALFQVFVALYLAEVTLLALFVFGKNWACVALEAFWIFVTVSSHLYMKWKFIPLFETVPISALKYGAGDRTFQYPMYDQGFKEIKTEGKNYWEGGNQLGLVKSPIDQVLLDTRVEDSDVNTGTGSNEKFADSKLEMSSADGNKAANITHGGSFTRFLKPKLNTFDMIRDSMPPSYFNYIEYNPEFVKTAYSDPAVNDDEPHIWIPKDDLGLSEIEKNKAIENGIDCSDANAGFDETGNLLYYGPPPTYEETLRV